MWASLGVESGVLKKETEMVGEGVADSEERIFLRGDGVVGQETLEWQPGV